MTLDGVTKTEYTYTAQQGQGVRAQQSSFTNSVMTEAAKNAENTSVEENKNTSKLDELLEKLCAELSKYGLKPEELKNSGILYRITGMNEQQIEKVSEQELKQIIECLKTAIKDTPLNSDGKINLEQVGKTANNYYIAIKTEWDSVEKFKRNQSGENLSQRMERFFGLKEGSFAKLPQDKIEEYLDRYFNQFFMEKIKKAKNPEKVYKLQLQDFGKLLINTADEDKAIFKQAISSLVSKNRLKGFNAVLMSFDTQEARTKWADSWTVEEKKDFALKADVEGNLPAVKDVTEFNAGLAKNQSEEGRLKSHEEFQKDAKAFFEQNKEILARIAEKEAKEEELTDEEKAVIHQIEQYYTPSSAGEFAGTAMNEIISKAFKHEMLENINKDAYELPNYKEVIQQITAYVKENSKALTMPKEEIEKLLDDVTNGNYSTVASGSEQTLKAPAEKPVETAETPDYGFVQKTEIVDTSRLESLKQQFYSEENNTFTVEKREESVSTNPAPKATSKLQAKLSGMNPQEQMNYIAKNFHNFSYGVKNAIGTRLEQLGHNNLMRVLSKINSDSFILGVYKQLGLKQDDIEDLNVSTGAKKIMLNSLQREEKRA